MSVTVSRAGFLTNVQDLGRPGFRRYGVSLGGALDTHAMRVANLLVGNDDADAGLEITFGGVRLRFYEERVISWGGGEFDVLIGERAVRAGHTALVREGEELNIGTAKRGCRAWIAISGGVDVPRVLDSRSTDWRARLGGIEGRALRDGDTISLGQPSELARALIDHLAADRLSSWSPTSEWVRTADPQPELRFVRGADWHRFESAAQEAFVAEKFFVTRDSNRMGTRLTGPQLKRKEEADLISEAVVPGTVQVPPSGDPIVLLGDCQTIGGYPKLAHVITVDFPIAAQLRADDRVRFHEVSMAEAERLWFEREHDLNCFRTGLNLRVS